MTGFSGRIVKQFMLLLLFESVFFCAYAENQVVQKTITNSQETSLKWLQTSALPSFITEVKRPAWINNAANWYQKKSREGDLQIHGFIGQSYIVTTHNNVFGNSDGGLGSFGLTEAGINASFRPLPRLLIAAQGLSRRAGEGSSGMPRLDFGFLDYRLYSHEANQFGIRVGRLKNPFGFYNDTRDVPFTRPSILLPQSIYFDRTRNLALSGDGVHLYGDISHPQWGTLSTQFGFLFPIVTDKDTRASVLIGDHMNGHLTQEPSIIGRGIYETNDRRIVLAVSGVWLNTDYVSRAGDKLGGQSISNGSLQFSPVYFSAQYNAERWSLTSEYAIRHFAYTNFNNTVLDGINFYGESYYVQGEYRFTPKWEGFVRYDALFTDRSDKSGKQWVSENPDSRHGLEHSRYAKDITVGIRWNITPEFMLRAEYHHVNGTGWLSRLDNMYPENTHKEWDLFAIQGSYRF